ncbi:hypothetical protein IG631_03551 [Alternaria alternata]|nr:hypothetical protein IG631_03551 [Alternaria alternata]
MLRDCVEGCAGNAETKLCNHTGLWGCLYHTGVAHESWVVNPGFPRAMWSKCLVRQVPDSRETLSCMRHLFGIRSKDLLVYIGTSRRMSIGISSVYMGPECYAQARSTCFGVNKRRLSPRG